MFDLWEKADVFLDGEAADVAEDEAAFDVFGLRSRTFAGREEVGVDAALHLVAGAAGGCGEHVAELGVGGEEEPGETVEACGCPERAGLDDVLGGARARPGGEVLGEEAGAAGGVLVDVGVPGCGEWDPELPAEVGSQDAEVAGAGDVDEVGPEAAEVFGDEGGVAGEERIELEIFFDADGASPAGEFEGLDGSGCLERLRSIAGADAEEWELFLSGVAHEVSAGVGDAVDFVKRVGEEGDAWRGGHQGQVLLA